MQEEETPENGSGGGGGGGGGGTHAYLWWAGASAAQLGWAVVSSRKGVGNSTLMPFKAFGVASLYVGSLATAAFAGLQASGIRKIFWIWGLWFPGIFIGFFLYTSQYCLGLDGLWTLSFEVEDLVELGANIRTGLGVHRRTRDE